MTGTIDGKGALNAKAVRSNHSLTNADLLAGSWVTEKNFGANQHDKLYLALITLRTAVEQRSAFVSRANTPTRNALDQRKAVFAVGDYPNTKDGIEKYLGSGMVKGIGPGFAKRMVDRFGTEILSIIENRSEELETVEGIGPKRRVRIKQAWQEGKQVREIMLFLHGNGVSTSKAVRIYKTYGDQAISKVKNNPYVLAKDIYGIGFKTADQIAHNLGIPKDSLNRASAGIDHVLLDATTEGHCALPLAQLTASATKLLEVAQGTVEQALSQMITKWCSAAGNNSRRVVDLHASFQESGRRHCSEDAGVGSGAVRSPAHRFREGVAVV